MTEMQDRRDDRGGTHGMADRCSECRATHWHRWFIADPLLGLGQRFHSYDWVDLPSTLKDMINRMLAREALPEHIRRGVPLETVPAEFLTRRARPRGA